MLNTDYFCDMCVCVSYAEYSYCLGAICVSLTCQLHASANIRVLWKLGVRKNGNDCNHVITLFLMYQHEIKEHLTLREYIIKFDERI